MGAILNRDALTANGRTLWENNRDSPRYDLEGTKRVIRPLDDPFKPHAGIAVLRGNLARRSSNKAISGDAGADEASRSRSRLRNQ
jgi:dihydroxy-acid dehydratase